MKRQTALTKRDKALLYILALGLALFAFVKLYALPAMDEIDSLGMTITDLENERAEMDVRITSTAALTAENEKLLGEYGDISGLFSARMENYDADKELTRLILNYGLTIESLIFGTQTQAAVQPYVYSQAAGEASSAASDMICLPVTAEVSGSREDVEAFRDCLLSKVPALRVTYYSESSKMQADGDTYYELLSLKIGFELYMRPDSESEEQS